MPNLSIQPPSPKVLKDCFRSTVEYKFISIASDEDNDIEGEEVHKKVKVLHEVFHLEAYLMWRAQLKKLMEQKQWNAVAKFTNVGLLLDGDASEKWIGIRTNHAAAGGFPNRNPTEAQLQEDLDELTLCFCSRADTEKLHEMINSAKKPSNMSIRDFATRIKILNGYLHFLPAPLNERISDDRLAYIIHQSVPDWKDSLIKSNTQLDNIRDITSYYQDLEELEISRSRRSRNRTNRESGGRRDGHRNYRNSNQPRNVERYHTERRNDNTPPNNDYGRGNNTSPTQRSNNNPDNRSRQLRSNTRNNNNNNYNNNNNNP
jgi:hypothetical protein